MYSCFDYLNKESFASTSIKSLLFVQNHASLCRAGNSVLLFLKLWTAKTKDPKLEMQQFIKLFPKLERPKLAQVYSLLQ